MKRALFFGIALMTAGCVESAGDGASMIPSDTSAPEVFEIGTPATAAQIAAWDIDVMPDGKGLPPGSGSVANGARIYAAQCAVCHGRTGREGPEHPLVGRMPDDSFPFSEADTLFRHRTIGSYWPYAPTLFDYIRRTMPFDRPGSLSDEEVYSVTAWLLHANEILDEDAVLDAATLSAVEMPARDRFVVDDRLEFIEVH